MSHNVVPFFVTFWAENPVEVAFFGNNSNEAFAYGFIAEKLLLSIIWKTSPVLFGVSNITNPVPLKPVKFLTAKEVEINEINIRDNISILFSQNHWMYAPSFFMVCLFGYHVTATNWVHKWVANDATAAYGR